MTADLNATLYANELFVQWTTRDNLNITEAYFLNKYLTDKSKNVLEAGTGGGIISFEIEKKGFTCISAFDIVPSMVNCAREIAKQKKAKIIFDIADATNLKNFKNNQFDYLVYLQQVLCFVPNDTFLNALSESYRVANKDAICIYSFLDYDARKFNWILSFVVNFIRKIRGEQTLKHYLPWLKIGKKYNWKLFNKNQAQTFWVKRDNIVNELKKLVFNILEMKNDCQINKQKSAIGMLYIVCKK